MSNEYRSPIVQNIREYYELLISPIVQGIVKNYNGNLLTCNGGHFVLGKPWAKSILSHWLCEKTK